MKIKTYSYLFSLIILLVACSNGSDFPLAENALDAAREYIDGTLKGDFRKSIAYLKQDAENLKTLDSIKNHYYQFNDVQRQDYRNASIIIQKEKIISDKASVIFFHNSLDKKEDSLKVLFETGKWLVTY